MRVLVTRPEPASARTAAELERLGHQPILLPLMQAIQHPETLASPPLTGTTALAVTSAEAMRVLESLPGEARYPFLALPLFAVGRATARAAGEAGFKDIAVADGDGRSLAGLLIAKTDQNPGAPILYLTGSPRTPEFETTLADAGRSMDVRECYRMIPATYEDNELARKLTPMPDAILAYSSETALRIGEIFESTRASLNWSETRLLCLSEKIAKALPEEFQPRAEWPMEPREDLLLLLL